MTAPTHKRFDSVALSVLILTGHPPHFGQESLLAFCKPRSGSQYPPALVRSNVRQ